MTIPLVPCVRMSGTHNNAKTTEQAEWVAVNQSTWKASDGGTSVRCRVEREN